jgi:hypothetical protein
LTNDVEDVELQVAVKLKVEQIISRDGMAGRNNH